MRIITNYVTSSLLICDPGETRTPNLLIRSQMLYPLSYGAILSESGAKIILFWNSKPSDLIFLKIIII
jgi:hypothetical protein